MRNVFKYEYQTDRAGIIISETTKGFKVESWSVYSDETDKTYFIYFNNEFKQGFRAWEKEINDCGTTYWQLLLHRIHERQIIPYRTITA